MALGAARYYKRDFWINENLSYVKPHFRLEKCSRLVNDIAKGRKCDLLDVGCGPATLKHFLTENINYYGIDIAIQSPAPYLMQADFVDGKIGFRDKRFDIIVAQGVFEYVGHTQSEKFAEIRQALKDDGAFVATYVNFNHWNRDQYVIYNNVQPAKEFRKSLERQFHVKRCFATSHHWHHHEPNRSYMKALQMPFELNIPVLSRLFAIEYFFICSPRRSDEIKAR
jgi:SAM-dependent methyltransferase